VTTLILQDPAAAAPLEAPFAVGVVADEIGRRRIDGLLGSPFVIVAGAASTAQLVDALGMAPDVAILAGGPELLARGGPVAQLRALLSGCAIVAV